MRVQKSVEAEAKLCLRVYIAANSLHAASRSIILVKVVFGYHERDKANILDFHALFAVIDHSIVAH
jgi:hypothetical protein